jgi:hypothetical protein
MTIDPDAPVRPNTSLGTLPGRRMRCLARLVEAVGNGVKVKDESFFILMTAYPPTYRELMAGLGDGTWPAGFHRLEELRLRTGQDDFKLRDSIEEEMNPMHPNASLHRGLQDLSDSLAVDIVGACDALDDPDVYYPGVDDGIEPVTDEHVKLVMWGLNRELKRELRDGRPAVTLSDLPWHIQRALAERRRLRYKQWGIGQLQYERGTWSLWDVPEDPEWVPVRIFD